nr:hypothetical protein [Tanacetum cinerariifolium]
VRIVLKFAKFTKHRTISTEDQKPQRKAGSGSKVEHKDTKKSNEMYYPRFTKVIIHHFMLKDPSIPRRNRVKWHYVRDDRMFTTIKLPKTSVRKTRSSSDTTINPPTAAAGPRPTTTKKGIHAAKASKAKSLSALSEVAMTEAQQMKLATKRSLQQTHISQASGSGADEGTGSIPGVLDVPTDESEEEISWNSTDEEGDDDDEGRDGDDDDDGDDGEEGDGDNDDEDNDGEEGNDDEQASDKEEFIHPSLSTHTEEETRDEESFDPILKTPENSDDEGNSEENLGINVDREEGHDEEEEEDKDELYRDVNINKGRGPRPTTTKKGIHAAKASKAKSLSALSEVAMIEAQQMKLATKRSLQQTHISQASGSGVDEGTGSIPGVLDGSWEVGVAGKSGRKGEKMGLHVWAGTLCIAQCFE